MAVLISVERAALALGTAQPGLLLAHALDTTTPGQVVALVVLADGADVVLFRTTEALAAGRPASSVADQVAAGAPIAYGKYLAWRGFLPVEPPRRPEPARPSASAAGERSSAAPPPGASRASTPAAAPSATRPSAASPAAMRSASRSGARTAAATRDGS